MKKNNANKGSACTPLGPLTHISPGSHPPTKYRTGKKSKYRRYWVFSGPNIGGFEENFRRFANF